ncbi:MAG: FecR domain-containing protein [Bdellovibrionales bacterium]|nr:FecR domain-containing protein [Bdellovibrionales bacterium]
MRSQLTRILIAIIFSGLIWFSTEAWYSTQKKVYSKSNKQTDAIARLKSHTNEVQRKPVARVIWQDLSSNELLYSGESIRTSNNGYAKIAFNDDNTVVELEPQSMIILERASDGLSLNYLEGQVVVENNSNLKVKANNQTIDMNKAKLSLSKSKDNNINLDIFSGQATVKDNTGKNVRLDSTTSGELSDKGVKTQKKLLQIIQPKHSESLSLHPSIKHNVVVKWKSIKNLTNLKVLVGKDRQSLSPVGHKFLKNGLMTKFPNGKVYWKVVGKHKNIDVESKIYTNTVNYLLPPEVIHPLQEAQISLSQSSKVYTSWINPGSMERLYLEVSKKPDFKSPFIKQYLNQQDSLQDLNINNKGSYYLRITGFTQVNKNWEALRSETVRFYVIEPTVLKSPDLIAPINNYSTNSAEIFKNKLSFNWKPEKIAKSYELILRDTTTNAIQKFQTPSTNFTLADIKSGNYEWTVISVNGDQKSAYETWNSFKVDNKSIALSWNMKNTDTLWYITKSPNVNLKWTPLSLKKIKYEITWQNNSSKQSQEWIAAKSPSNHKLNLPKDDNYSFRVRGLNSKGKVVAMSPVFTANVKMLPLLSEPKILPENESIIQSNASGEVYINWTKIDKAKEYELTLINSDGTKVTSSLTNQTEKTLKGLKPGSYTVKIKTVDSFNRSSEKTAEKQINVPDLSNITPPKLKGISVQ